MKSESKDRHRVHCK